MKEVQNNFPKSIEFIEDSLEAGQRAFDIGAKTAVDSFG